VRYPLGDPNDEEEMLMADRPDWALLVIDMQNDFVLPDAVLCVQGALATVPAIDRACRWFRGRAWPVVWVTREHAADGTDVETMRLALFRRQPFLVPGTPGCALVEGLRPEPGDLHVVKRRWSAFLQTELDWVLRRLGVTRIAVAGTQIPNCLRATVYDAVSHGYEAVLLTDCCSAQDEAVAEANYRDLRNIGVGCLPLEAFAAGPADA
jgi:nicotinamidase-related amidase